VCGDFVVVSPNITDNVILGAGKVSDVQLAQFVIYLGREDALVSEGFEGYVKAAKARE